VTVRELWDGRELEYRMLVIHDCITLSKHRHNPHLRNHFPKVRKLVETEGEVLLTEKGKPRYRLMLYTPARTQKPLPIDYWARLHAYQPQAITEAQARASTKKIVASAKDIYADPSALLKLYLKEPASRAMAAWRAKIGDSSCHSSRPGRADQRIGLARHRGLITRLRSQPRWQRSTTTCTGPLHPSGSPLARDPEESRRPQSETHPKLGMQFPRHHSRR